MATGDLKNNLRKLRSELRTIKYVEDVDYENLGTGSASSYLPIYHYVFVNYSRPIAEKIAAMQIEMCGKTDLRFVEAMYKVLREMFCYRPPITKDQFFAPGFAERKVMMCTQVIQLLREKHRTLAGVPRSTTAHTRQNQNAVPATLDSVTKQQKPGRVKDSDLRNQPAEKRSDFGSGSSGQVVDRTEKPKPLVVREIPPPTADVTPVWSMAEDDDDDNDDDDDDDARPRSSLPRHCNEMFATSAVDSHPMLAAVNKIADAVHLLGLRIDAIDRRMTHIESLERRLSDFSDVNQRLHELTQMEQRVANIELRLSTDNQRTNDNTETELKSLGANVESVSRQLSNLVARMTLAENQLLLLQSSGVRSSFPASVSNVVTTPPVNDSEVLCPRESTSVISQSDMSSAGEPFVAVNSVDFTPSTTDVDADSTKDQYATNTRSEQAERIEAMLRGTEELLQKRSEISLN